MGRRLNLLFQYFLELAPFDVCWRLPIVTLAPVDLLLASYEARGDAITILQIGACDGVTNDPIHRHVEKGLNRAVLVEPNPLAFARLQKTYAGCPNVTLVQCAIAEQDGEAHLYRLKRTGMKDAEVDLTLQISSFYRKHLERHGKEDHEIERIAVSCRSLSSLVAELGLTRIDLLQIDVEGFDAQVVRMALKLPVLPDCIHFEHLHLGNADRKPLFDSLHSSGYLLGYDAWNVLALQTQVRDELRVGKA